MSKNKDVLMGLGDDLQQAPRANARRAFLTHSAALGGATALVGLPGILQAANAPAVLTGDRPIAAQGLQIGDVWTDRAVIWSRADRASRFYVEWSSQANFANATLLRGPHALEDTDYTARLDLTGLPAGQTVHVRVTFENLDKAKARSEAIVGSFRTAPTQRRDVRFVWGGDTAGQGWGINPDMGGMRCYEAMRQTHPDFFIHSGDNIYADGIMKDSVTLADGNIWRNIGLDLYPAKRKVAETMDEFRQNYLYNLYDENLRRFNAEVPQIWQWDDHEVINNWSDSKDITSDARYTEKRVPLLIARASRAFHEFAPMRPYDARESERVYRRIPYTRDLEVFVIDMRSYRAGNSFNRQTQAGEDTAYLGREQLDWLKRSLKESRATWKVIASDMPIGLLVADGNDAQGRAQFEAVANGDGTVLGREFEFAELFSFLKRESVRNIVWLTADVHYCAAHYYDPSKAQFQDFEGFWEFVAGPLHAGTFGPNAIDNTFGPQVVFQKAPPAGQVNLPPSAGYQFFGQIDIDHRSKHMTVALKDLNGAVQFSRVLQAQDLEHSNDD